MRGRLGRNRTKQTRGEREREKRGNAETTAAITMQARKIMKGKIVAASAGNELARAIGRGSVTVEVLAVTYRVVGINSGLFVALLIQH